MAKLEVVLPLRQMVTKTYNFPEEAGHTLSAHIPGSIQLEVLPTLQAIKYPMALVKAKCF